MFVNYSSNICCFASSFFLIYSVNNGHSLGLRISASMQHIYITDFASSYAFNYYDSSISRNDRDCCSYLLKIQFNSVCLLAINIQIPPTWAIIIMPPKFSWLLQALTWSLSSHHPCHINLWMVLHREGTLGAVPWL